MAMLPDPFGTFLQFQQALDALRGSSWLESPHEDTGAVIYDCDPQANRRAIVRVIELCRFRLLKGTREEAIGGLARIG